MIRLAVFLVIFSATLMGQDGPELLAKAHQAFIDNTARARLWNWTVVSTRTVTDKAGTVLEELPSVTIESPIRSDGKRCNAVLAWGDGREAYLAAASADQRCAIEKEVADLLPLEKLLESRQVRVVSQTEGAITLAIREDKQAAGSADPVKRCVASVEASVELDAASFFPKNIDIRVPDSNCEQKHVTADDHYDGGAFRNLRNGYSRGTRMKLEYREQKDKGGDSTKDYWMCTRRHSERVLPKNSNGVVVSGRLFKLNSRGADRRMIADGVTTGSELSAESVLKFTPEKER